MRCYLCGVCFVTCCMTDLGERIIIVMWSLVKGRKNQ